MNDRLMQKRTLARMMLGALMMVVYQSARAEDSIKSPPRFWAGIGLGYGYIQAASPAPSGAGGVWLEARPDCAVSAMTGGSVTALT